MDIGDRLREALTHKRWSAHRLFRELEESGIPGTASYASISSYQNEPNADEMVSLAYAKAVAEKLEVRKEWFGFGSGEMTEEEEEQARQAREGIHDYPIYSIRRDADSAPESAEDEAAFGEVLEDGFPEYSEFTPTVMHVFNNAYARWIKYGMGPQGAVERAKVAVELGRLVLEPLRTFKTKLDTRSHTDFMLAQLHALMLAIPTE
jgi:transcriptional regulator with XRE-family HTH domain